jgi:tetratricopeptide (TPR) repeat protein
MQHISCTCALLLALTTLGLPGTLLAQESPAPPQQAAENADAGAYLGAIVASAENDFVGAATSFTRALIADPTNPALLDGAVVANVGAGRIENAVTIASQIPNQADRSIIATTALLADQARRGDFEAILADQKPDRDIGLLLELLTKGWAELGAGRMSEAQAAFDKLSGTEGVEVLGLYHKALALASAGDFEGANAIFTGVAGSSIETLRRGVIAHAQILSQLERNPDAIKVLDRIFVPGQDPVIAALRARLEAGEPVPFDVTRNAVDGMAETFFTLAAGLNGEADDTHTLIYARLAAWLRPDHAEAQLMTAGLLERLDQPDLASATYAAIKPDDPAFLIAEMGRASALSRSGKTDTAIEVLSTLARSHAGMIDVHRQLGDLLRREDKFEAATVAYDAAIALLGPNPPRREWALFYARGIGHERQNRWDLAEADFNRALELEPDQPMVLNYMGYSLLEMNRDLDKALSMIERAVAAEPDSGYILDSLAWAYFRLGRYAEALEPMERASILEPVDPVVTDHLGDVYWAVGRKLEAQFQWRRALSFEPEEEADADRIRRKLVVGLDAVLAEEGQKPIEAQTAADGN